jgi:hypothetical protein
MVNSSTNLEKNCEIYTRKIVSKFFFGLLYGSFNERKSFGCVQLQQSL